MKILAFDVGAGTEDVLLYDSGKDVENCIKMVLPSPTPLFARRVQAYSMLGRDLFVDGDTIGGGVLRKRLREHVEKGCRVFMTENAVFTLYNNLNRVKALGIEIVENPPEDFMGAHITLREVDVAALRKFLGFLEEPLDDLDAVAVAVQDHGVPPEGVDQNWFRMEKIMEHFQGNPSLQSPMFSEGKIPEFYLRMKAAAKTVRRDLPDVEVFVMDSALAAVLGCMQDAEASYARPTVAINIGNSHTTAAFLQCDRLVGFMEHHTSLLTPEKLEGYLEKLWEGTLTNDEVLSEGGHGAFYLSKPSMVTNDVVVLATGPRRKIIQKTGLRFRFAAPGGDVMMTGNMGLVKAAVEKLNQ